MADRLDPGQSLQLSESLVSPSGQYSLLLQVDGNLVLHDQDGQPSWASGTDGQQVATASMQQDGNLVLYTSSGDAVWASGTDGNDGASLVLQDDRNLVIYASDGSPLWASNSAA